MALRRTGSSGFLVAAALGLISPAQAQSASAAQAGLGARAASTASSAIRHTFVTAGGRAEIVEETAPLATTPSSIGVNTSGALWTYPDNGEGWVARAVTLGNAGTEVFTEFDTAADRASLLSGFDVTPVVPVWADPVAIASTNVRVHGSDQTGLFVSCRQIPVTQNGPRSVVVSAYTSSSSMAQWSWTFPTPTYGGSRAMVSADGRRIVAGMLDPNTATLHVAVFDGGSSIPTGYFSRSVGLQLQAIVLSEDGHTLYAATQSGGYLFDVDTGTLIQQIVLLQSFAAQDISGDGSILAVGYFNGVDVWERQAAGNYLRTWQGSWPGSIVCQQLDVSEDGSTLVLGFGYFDQNLRVRIEAIDLATKATLMVDEAQGGGSLQNIVAKVATSANGQRFAVGLWGDEADLVPELRIYRRGQNTPVATYNYGGSVYDLAMSRSGDRVVVGRKAVHANTLAGGGSVDLYSNGDEDFVAVGTPSIGRKVDFELWGAPNSPARLLLAPHPSTNLFPIGSIGVLYLRRSELTILPMPMTDSVGYSRGEYQLPLDPAAIGTTLWFQGLTTAPRRFSRDFVQLTILP
ncbi:MAG: hypothetical protein NTY35_04680 [Planctomycetota bacterium]|nr:hypothetical protein [Planctomycetota bacterium]